MNASIAEALHLAELSERDPLAAARNGPKLVAVLRELAEHHPTATEHRSHAHGDSPKLAEADIAALGVTNIVRVKSRKPIAAPGPSGDPVILGPIRVEWPGGTGYVRSLFAGTTDGDPANLSRVSVRISINGTDEVVTNGEEEDFAPLVSMQAQNHNWLKLKDFEVTAAQRWTVHFAYEGPGGPPQVTPFLLFGYARKSHK